jgi:hypothetical protein
MESVDLFKEATLFALTLHQFGNRKSVDKNKVKLVVEGMESSAEASEDSAEKVEEKAPDSGSLNTTKRLLKCDELSAITSYQDEVKEWCLKRSMPAGFRPGLYLVKLTEVDNFRAELKKAKEHMASELVPAFIAAYPQAIEEAKERLQELFEESDYPPADVIAKKFGFSDYWLKLTIDDRLEQEAQMEAANNLKKSFAKAQGQIVKALQDGFAGLLTDVTTRLETKPGEEPKTFKSSLFEKLTEFMETFSARNLVNDAQLDGLVSQAKQILSEVHGKDADSQAKTIRKSPQARAKMVEAFKNLQGQLAQVIESRPVRQFDFD